MRPGAHVNSIEALEQFRAALAMFGHDVEQSLVTIQCEIRDFVEWLEHDLVMQWRREISVRTEKVKEANADLHRCLSATVDDRTPSCHQEKKLLAHAQQRLAEAEASLAAVRRWIPIVRRAVQEYGHKVEPLRSAVASDVPRATAILNASVARLLEYLSVAPPPAPTLSPAEDAPPTGPSMAQPTSGATEKPPPAGSPADEQEKPDV